MNNDSLDRRVKPDSEVSAQDIVDIVEHIHGVVGIEAGVSTAMQAIDSRLRGRDDKTSLFGVIIDERSKLITIEVCLNNRAPLCCIVREIQQKVSSCYNDHVSAPAVRVRVMSRI